MRQFKKRMDCSPAFVPILQPISIERTGLSKPGLYNTQFGTVESRCVNCEAKHCIVYGQNEVPVNFPEFGRGVCPSNAISFSESLRTIEFTDACINCNLCVLRCPYCSLFTGVKTPNTLPFCPDSYREKSTVEAFDIFQLPKSNRVSSREIRSSIDRAIDSLRYTDKSTYYPLIGTLLTSLGLSTVVSRAGDTNNRMDAVIIDQINSIPIEIKSPTETEYINVKAVRQAVENKIVMTARNMFPTRTETTTLAVGYLYPNARSDVDELIDDIAAVYNINVGIVSLEILLILAWNHHVRGDTASVDKLKLLKGRASAKIL